MLRTLADYHLRFPFSAIPPPSFSLVSILSSSRPHLFFFVFLFSFFSLSLFSFSSSSLSSPLSASSLLFLFFYLESFPFLRAFARTVILTLYTTLRTLLYLFLLSARLRVPPWLDIQAYIALFVACCFRQYRRLVFNTRYSTVGTKLGEEIHLCVGECRLYNTHLYFISLFLFSFYFFSYSFSLLHDPSLVRKDVHRIIS